MLPSYMHALFGEIFLRITELYLSPLVIKDDVNPIDYNPRILKHIHCQNIVLSAFACFCITTLYSNKSYNKSNDITYIKYIMTYIGFEAFQ